MVMVYFSNHSEFKAMRVFALFLPFLMSMGVHAQIGAGWDVESCQFAVQLELGKRAAGVSEAEVASLCSCMAARWESMVDLESIETARIRVADECVADWPDGIVLSWRNSAMGMSIPIDGVLDEAEWMEQLWMLGENVWLVKVVVDGQLLSLPGKGGDVIELMVIGDKAVAYLDDEVDGYWSMTSLKTGNTAWMQRSKVEKLRELSLSIDLGFVEVGRTGTEGCIVVVQDSSAYDMMLNVRKGGQHDALSMEAGSVTEVSMDAGTYQFLAWIPEELDIIPAFGAATFKAGTRYRWWFFVE